MILDLTVTVEDAGWGAVDRSLTDEDEAEIAIDPLVAAALRAAGDRVPEGHTVEVSVVFAGDATVRRLNRTWRGQDKATNVLSFALAEEDGAPLPADAPIILGDVVLARETVLREAAEQGKLAWDHTRHLIVHGVLHLVGHDHGEDGTATAMESLEASILASFGIADPYAPATPAAPSAD
jgi:probable rRNA maturation factor